MFLNALFEADCVTTAGQPSLAVTLTGPTSLLPSAAQGSYIVGYGNSASGNEAFRWTAEGGMVGLGSLPGGSFLSIAQGVSADGMIIVGKSGSGANRRAFVWDRAHGMRDLRSLLVNDFRADLTGWQLREATGVSADGRTIVGIGFDPSGDTEAWRVTFFCEALAADDDADGDVDLRDFARFSICFTGRDDAQAVFDPFRCGCFDADQDRDVDADDFQHFESVVGGP